MGRRQLNCDSGAMDTRSSFMKFLIRQFITSHILHGSIICIPLPDGKSNQRKYYHHAVYQDRPICSFRGRIRLRWEEHQYEGEPQKAQGQDVDRYTGLAERKSSRRELVASDLAVDDARDRDNITAQNRAGAERSDYVEGGVGTDENEREEYREG